RGAPSGEEAALVPKGDEEPLPGEAGCVDVVGLHVPLPGPVPPGVRRPLEEGHRSPSRSGRKYRMSTTLPFRSDSGLQTALTRMPIRISAFVISPKKCIIPIFGEAPSRLTTPTRIGSEIRFASVSDTATEYVSIVPVSRMYVHVSVGRKHSSQNIRSGNKMRSQR